MSKLGKRLINAAKSETKPIRKCPESQWGEGPGCGSESRQGVARRKGSRALHAKRSQF